MPQWEEAFHQELLAASKLAWQGDFDGAIRALRAFRASHAYLGLGRSGRRLKLLRALDPRPEDSRKLMFTGYFVTKFLDYLGKGTLPLV